MIVKVTAEMIDKELGNPKDMTMKATNKEEFREEAKLVDKMRSSLPIEAVDNAECSEKFIECKKSGSKIRTCIYKSKNAKSDVPGVLWIHGGGYAMGFPEQDNPIFKNLIQERDCVIIAPDYTLSTNAPYPKALEECYDILLWMKDNAKELGIKDDQIMVGGESAGGGLVAALTLYARDKGEVNICFQMPLYPEIDDRMTTESAKENDAPIWNSRLNRCAWELYLGELYGKDVPIYAAAARATDYSNLPPTATFIGDIEPFRDETIQYVENLKKAGVSVDFLLCEGCYHGFDRVVPNAEISKKATKFLMNSFKNAVDNYSAKQK